MLRITFLGHQGWMIRCDDTTVLVDPLLDAHFGAVPGLGMQVFPPRQISHARFPAVSAVFFSHEHEDHFQMASLNRLSRRIPLYLSDRMSFAAERAASAMGFDVTRVRDGDALSWGHLGMTFFGARFAPDQYTEEWDVLTYLAEDLRDGATFYSPVDVLTPAHATRRFAQQPPTMIALANNYFSRHALASWMRPPLGSLRTVNCLLGEIDGYAAQPDRPAAFAVCGGGWSFRGAKERLNGSFFPADNAAVAAGLNTAGLNTPIHAPLPGETFLIVRRTVARDPGTSDDWLSLPPRAEWPSRAYDPRAPRWESIPPLLPPQDLSAETISLIGERLARLATNLTGTRFFLALNSLTSEELKDRRRAFVLVLRVNSEGDALVFEYTSDGRGFQPTEAPPEAFAAGALCWASDLLALLMGRLSPGPMIMGHLLEWSPCSESFPVCFTQELWRLCHPLRMPEEYLALYLAQIAGSDTSAERVPHLSDVATEALAATGS